MLNSYSGTEPTVPTWTDLEALAAKVRDRMVAMGKTLATAESCTCGLVAAAIGSQKGASSFYLGGVVSYANDVKRDLLGVSQNILSGPGPVSLECASAMARGALTACASDVAIAVTGIAGPDGGTQAIPVGTVIFACATRRSVGDVRVATERCLFAELSGDRQGLRMVATQHALEMMLSWVEEC